MYFLSCYFPADLGLQAHLLQTFVYRLLDCARQVSGLASEPLHFQVTDDLDRKPRRTVGDLIRFSGLEVNMQSHYTSLSSNKQQGGTVRGSC